MTVSAVDDWFRRLWAGLFGPPSDLGANIVPRHKRKVAPGRTLDLTSDLADADAEGLALHIEVSGDDDDSIACRLSAAAEGAAPEDSTDQAIIVAKSVPSPLLADLEPGRSTVIRIPAAFADGPVRIQISSREGRPFVVERVVIFRLVDEDAPAEQSSGDQSRDRIAAAVAGEPSPEDRATPVEVFHDVEGGYNYEHMIRLDNGSDEKNFEVKAALLVPRFYDADFKRVRRHGNNLSVSSQFGEFVYLGLGAEHLNVIRLVVPLGARYYGYKIIPWMSTNYGVTEADLQQCGSTPSQQIKKLERELASLEDRAAGRIALIYTGTTRIAEKNRANRTMMIAHELAKVGWSVVYVYYRGEPHISIIEPQGERNAAGGMIIQVPNDLFANFSDSVVRSGRDSGIAILSIPDHGAVPLTTHLQGNGWRCLYEARDDWEDFRRMGAARWYDASFERFLARHADCTVSVSPPLRERCITFGAAAEHSHIIPNGAGDAFHRYFAAASSKPDTQRASTGKVGYFGHLTDQWFDWHAVAYLARMRPDLQIEIIGHGNAQARDLPNIKLLGPRTHEQIIEMSHDWEIALVPFVPGRLAYSVDPIKIYEYLCLELKVVSVNMDQIKDYPNVFIYKASEQIVDAVDLARATPFDHVANAAFSSNTSWASRSAALVDLLSEA